MMLNAFRRQSKSILFRPKLFGPTETKQHFELQLDKLNKL